MKYQLDEVIEKTGSKPFDPYETTRINILLNAFYLNILGAIDNLSWVIQHEFNLINGATESNSKKHGIGFFKKEFKKSLNKSDPDMVKETNNFQNWHDEIKNFRDSAAHRIPLFCPARVINSEDDEELSNTRNNFLNQDYSKDRKAYMNAQRELYQVGKFQPIFVHVSEESETIYPLSRTVEKDYDPFWELSSIAFKLIEKRLYK